MTLGAMSCCINGFRSRQVIQLLLENQLFQKAKKCEFHRSSITFLGYFIAEGNVQMDPGKLKAVVDWSQPTSRVQLQWFLGFANFYHRLIRDYSTQAAPISALTSPKVPLKWSPAVDKTFVDLKHRFTTAPILIHLDPFTSICGGSGCFRCWRGPSFPSDLPRTRSFIPVPSC
ncbi:uncharacterized mitochondrial protein AtMg00860-like [Oncorhynchus mykiss]|uniref:uncharacterized mitochondrial protein AtMg00860-like n=1 Tax=Oncorhynchus mykiss TaxID=8022 RepID=UPI0018775267|nr:uncharacterized mitochondrial protein AtMg00860-like [Oncorhynchus mykiss]